MRRAAHLFGPHSTKLPPVADTGVGAPTPKALSSTQTKVNRLRQPTGPDSVVLSANEVASLIGSSMDWSVRKSFELPMSDATSRSEEHTSELQSLRHLVCRLLLEKKKKY